MGISSTAETKKPPHVHFVRAFSGSFWPSQIEVSFRPFGRRRDGRKRKQDDDNRAVEAVAQPQQGS
jgi:hypothetical protein